VINVNCLEQALRRVQISAAIEGTRPLNVIIIGPSGGGKSLLLANCAASNAAMLMDFTSESLLRFCDREKPKFIINPDLNIVVSHKPSVANLTVAALLAITGEGVSKIPGIEGNIKFQLPEGFVCGVMTACTYDMYISKRGKWRQIGLLRRLLPLYFAYTPGTVTTINEHIAKGMTPQYKPNSKWAIPTTKHKVHISDVFSARLRDLASATMSQMCWQYRGKNGDFRNARAYDYSFDLHLMFRTYAKSCALERSAGDVAEQDYLETEILSRFVRLDRPNEI